MGAAWLVSSQSNEDTDRLLDSARTGTIVHVPALWILEVTNALLMLRRRERLDIEAYKQSLLDLIGLRAHVDDENYRLSMEMVSGLAERHNLSIYDAVYLELALRRGLPLASRDAILNKAAKRAGVKTLLAR